MSSLSEAIGTVGNLLSVVEPSRLRIRGVLGDGDGNVEVSDEQPYMVYFRRRDALGIVGETALEQVQLTAGDIPAIDGLPVIVGEDGITTGIKVLSRDTEFMADWLFNWVLRSHHEQHQLYDAVGFDVVWIQSQQFLPLLGYPTNPATMRINVNEGYYHFSSGWHFFSGAVSADLTSYVPTLGAQMAR